MIAETDPRHAALSPNGWARLPSGVWVTKVPVVDTSEPGLTAQLDYEGCLAVAHREGVQLIEPATVIELCRFGHHAGPVILPDAAQRAASPRAPGETKLDYEGRIRRGMGSIEWRRRHDYAVWADLAVDWDLELPVADFGKFFVSGADPGRSRLFGWPKLGQEWWRQHDLITSGDFESYALWWQPLMNAHNRAHSDYGTKCMLQTRDTPTASIDSGPPTEPGGAGARALARAVSQLGVREETGRNDGEQIARYFSGATRRINGVERPTGWRSGWEWCAAFYGWSGGPGWRIAVHEYVSDAIAANTWRPIGSGYVPRPGDALILCRWTTEDGIRVLSDPTRGQNGHIARVESYHPEAGIVIAIGGNEHNAVSRTERRIDDVLIRGYIQVDP